jgi:putative flippase GtrA
LRYIFAQVVATGCVFVWNFTMHKHWTFRAAARLPEDGAGVFEREALRGRICPK